MHSNRLLSLTLIASMIVSPAVAASVESLRQQAQSFYRDGRYTEATGLYRKIASQASSDPAVLKEVMWALWNMQQFEEATKIAHQVIALKPKDLEAQNILSWGPKASNREKMHQLKEAGLKNYQAGRYDQAADFYRQLVDLAPNDVANMKDWMFALSSAQRHTEAGQVANRILKLQPDDKDSRDVLEKAPRLAVQKQLTDAQAAAAAAQSSEQYDKVVASYKEILRLRPQDMGVLRNLAAAYIKMKKTDEAEQTARQMAQIAPQDPSGWNMIARAQIAANNYEGAAISLEESLRINPNQLDAQMDLGKIQVRLRNLDRGIELLEAVHRSGQAHSSLYPILGKALFFKGEYARSADMWAIAAAKDKGQFEHRFFEAQARYYAGLPKGMIDLEELSSVYQDTRATDFLTKEAVARGDLPAAQQLLEKQLKDIRPGDEPKAMQLASLYFQTGQTEQCLKLAARVRESMPRHFRAALLQAKVYRERQLYAKASQYYRQALEINPNGAAARLGLADCEFAQGHYDEALKQLRHLRKEDPTNPYLILREARYAYETGEPELSRQLLINWIDQNAPHGLVPILLYHGLTPIKNDPILSDPSNYPISTFEEHMKALHGAGYTAITTTELVNWLHGKSDLPSKPVLITFDDGRLDSLKYADPILKRYNFKAAMFETLENAEGSRPIAYAPWSTIQEYQKTGRWEIQSHGHFAHTPMPIDEARKGLWIANRRWNSDQKSLESPEEWRQRVTDDYESSKKRISEMTGTAPVGYAYAEGEYGQTQTNYPDAAVQNMALVRKVYDAAFVQDEFGSNSRTRDPARLWRLEPGQDWSGQTLLTHFRDKNPFVFFYQELLHQALWKDRTREASTWLNKLTDLGVSERLLWSEQARVHYAAGDYREGFDYATRVLSYSPEHFEKLTETLMSREGPAWNPGFVYQVDNRKRKTYAVDQRFQLPPFGSANWFLLQRSARYEEPGIDSITQHAAGLGVDFKLGLFQKASLDVMGHMLSRTARNNISGSGTLESRWTVAITTTLQAARNIHYPARALNKNIIENNASLTAQWSDQDRWTIRGRGRFYLLSDDNRRGILQGEISRAINTRRTLRLTYRAKYDDMKNDSADYYSPQQLLLNEFGPDYSAKLTDRLTLKLSYFPGLGREKGTKTEVVHDVQSGIQIGLSQRFWVMPTYWFHKTPNYWQHTGGLLLRYHFGEIKNLGAPVTSPVDRL